MAQSLSMDDTAESSDSPAPTGDDTAAADGFTDEPQTTEVPPATTAAPELAWSAAIELDEPGHPSWMRTTALATGIVAAASVIAAGLWFAAPGFRTAVTNRVEPQRTSAAPTTTVVAPVVAAPQVTTTVPVPTVTVTAAAPAPTTTPEVAPTTPDDRYLRMLAADGVPVPSPDVAIRNGRHVCAVMAADPRLTPVQVADALSAQSGLSWSNADSVVQAAILVYCDQLYRSSS